MMVFRFTRLFFAAFALFVFASFCANAKPGPESGPDDIYWDDQFAPPGADGLVNAMIRDPLGNVYVGGYYHRIGGVAADSIAKWDGLKWSPLGSGVDQSVHALALDPSGNLYIGGHFYAAGGNGANHIAKWDGAKWSPVGSGVNDGVYALACDSVGNLYAGGVFTRAGDAIVNHIAKWDGARWSALETGITSSVLALTCGSSGYLYVGGHFDKAGSINARNIAKWDGSRWSPLATGMNSSVRALTFDSLGNLLAAGDFTSADSISAKYVAKWNGFRWSALGTGLASERSGSGVQTIVFDSSGTLHAGGTFGVARLEGLKWLPLGTEIGGSVSALAFDSSGLLFAGGNLISADGLCASYIAKWGGSRWLPIATGMGAYGDDDVGVYAFASDSLGLVYIGGHFPCIGGLTNANGIAKWDGTKWASLGAGMQGGEDRYRAPCVNALDVDSRGNLYAGGDFSSAGGTKANNVAIWDGLKWSALGDGLDGSVSSLACDSSGNLYVAGDFSHAGGVSAALLAKWDGSSWSAVATDVQGYYHHEFDEHSGRSYTYQTDPSICDIICDSLDNLYVAGVFSQIDDGFFNSIAKWDGSAWWALGEGMGSYHYRESWNDGDWYTDPVVFDFAFDSFGKLCAGGDFMFAGGIEVNNVAKWDGSDWLALSNGIEKGGYEQHVHAITCDSSGRLYAASSDSPNRWYNDSHEIKKWDGSNWIALGSEMSGNVKRLFVQSNTLFAGGTFLSAGGKASYSIAQWQPRVNDRWTTFAASPGAKTLGDDAYGFYKPALKTFSGTTLSYPGGRLPAYLGLIRAEKVLTQGKRINGAFSLKPKGVSFGGAGATIRVEFSEDDAALFRSSYKTFIPVKITYPSNYPTSLTATKFQELPGASAPAPIRIENGRQIYAITVPISSIPSTSPNYGALPRSIALGTPIPTVTRTPTIARTPTRTPTRTSTPTRTPTPRPPTQSRNWETYR